MPTFIFLSPAIAQVKTENNPVASKPKITFQRADGKIDVLVDGNPFTTVDCISFRKPILFPVYNSNQQAMTRGFPMKTDSVGEQHDHPHHKSVWFSHDIDDVDFWTEKHGQVEVSGVKMQPKLPAVSWVGDWIDMRDQRQVCQDQTTVKFFADQKTRTIDYQVEMSATGGDITFADSKEGSFAIRVHPHLRLDPAPKAGPQQVFGKIVNSEGQTGKKVWGKRARWVMYFGQIDGKAAAIAMFDHPKNLRHPTTWHARGYGLFAANPFGLHHFENKPAGEGTHRLRKGKKLKLRYRAIFFSNVPEESEIETRYSAFAVAK
jgi:hypothetical protein